MKNSEIISKTRRLTKASESDYSNTEMLSDFNRLRREMLMYILQSQNYLNIGVDTLTTDLKDYRNLSEGEIGYDGEYPFDLSIVSVKRIELKMKATSDYAIADFYRITNNDNSEFEDLDTTFSVDTPKVKEMRKSLIIRPLPEEDVTDGMKIICALNEGLYFDASTNKEKYGDTTEDDDFDLILDVSFHGIYPRLLALEYFEEDPKKYTSKIALQRNIVESMRNDIDDHYATAVATPLKIKTVNHSFK